MSTLILQTRFEASRTNEKTEGTSKGLLGSPSGFSSLTLSILREVYIFDAEASQRVEKTEGTSKGLLGLPSEFDYSIFAGKTYVSTLK